MRYTWWSILLVLWCGVTSARVTGESVRLDPALVNQFEWGGGQQALVMMEHVLIARVLIREFNMVLPWRDRLLLLAALGSLGILVGLMVGGLIVGYMRWMQDQNKARI